MVETSPPPQGRFDTLVTVGGPDPQALASDVEVADLIRLLARRSRRVASVCTGAFLLASSGLLDGRRAPTHWRYAKLLENSYPAVTVDDDRIFVRDGEIWTSAGITAGIDLALAMIEEDCGLDLAKSVARDLVVTYRRQGGQSQFSTSLQLGPRPGRIRDALAFARERLAEQLPVDRLASQVGVGARQFARQFTAETGETPARAIERLRLEAAVPRIEASTEPLEQIASGVGFGDLERMRRSCLRVFGQTPQALRRQHRSART